MLKLKKINRNNIGEILKLEFFDNQKSFVATNNSSIIEAYIAITENNDVAWQLYKSAGFVETDEKDGEEIVAILEL